MLTPLDDTLLHQLPTTFDHAFTSDHQFFDRYWFSLFDTKGEVLVVSTMGLYKNMNVLDGAGCAIDTSTGRYHNVRVSRELRPNIAFTGAGPLHYELVRGTSR